MRLHIQSVGHNLNLGTENSNESVLHKKIHRMQIHYQLKFGHIMTEIFLKQNCQEEQRLVLEMQFSGSNKHTSHTVQLSGMARPKSGKLLPSVK